MPNGNACKNTCEYTKEIQKNTSKDVKDKVVIVIVNTLIFKTRMLSTIK